MNLVRVSWLTRYVSANPSHLVACALQVVVVASVLLLEKAKKIATFPWQECNIASWVSNKGLYGIVKHNIVMGYAGK